MDFTVYEFNLSDISEGFYISIVFGIRFKYPNSTSEEEINIIEILCDEKFRSFIAILRIIFWEIIDNDRFFTIRRKSEDFIN